MEVQSKSMCLHSCTVSLSCANACSHWRPEPVNAAFLREVLRVLYEQHCTGLLFVLLFLFFVTSQDPPHPFMHGFLGHGVMKANNNNDKSGQDEEYIITIILSACSGCSQLTVIACMHVYVLTCFNMSTSFWLQDTHGTTSSLYTTWSLTFVLVAPG